MTINLFFKRVPVPEIIRVAQPIPSPIVDDTGTHHFHGTAWVDEIKTSQSGKETTVTVSIYCSIL